MKNYQLFLTIIHHHRASFPLSINDREYRILQVIAVCFRRVEDDSRDRTSVLQCLAVSCALPPQLNRSVFELQIVARSHILHGFLGWLRLFSQSSCRSKPPICFQRSWHADGESLCPQHDAVGQNYCRYKIKCVPLFRRIFGSFCFPWRQVTRHKAFPRKRGGKSPQHGE